MNEETDGNQIMERGRRSGMTDVLTILAMIGVWLLLTQVILPKLGVPT